MKITAIANLDNEQILVSGEIIINSIQEPQVYVTWKLFNKESLIASRSENYFYDSKIDNEQSLLRRVINKIENYRIGRKKVFEKVAMI